MNKYTLESFIDFCGDMEIVEEGFFDRFKKKKIEPKKVTHHTKEEPKKIPEKKPSIPTINPITVEEAKKILDIASKFIKKNYSDVKGVRVQTLEDSRYDFNEDIDGYEQLNIISFDLWDFNPQARTDPEGMNEKFEKISVGISNELTKILPNGITYGTDGDWDGWIYYGFKSKK